jgi:hypothetical protein
LNICWRLLHHNNMPAHTSLRTTEFVTNFLLAGLSPMISLYFPN